MSSSNLSVCIMVKNEALNIEASLQPFLEHNIPIFVYDTGSTDGTVEILEKNKGINFEYVCDAFVDFSTSRNRALLVAYNHFKTEYILMIDAEWYIENVPALIEFCNKNKSDDKVYLVRISHKTLAYCVPRLFKYDESIKYVGVVHEVPDYPASIVVDDVHFRWAPTDKGKEKSRLRWYSDAALLTEEYNKSPTPRTTFYLAQTYECLEEHEISLKYYKLRSEMNGWVEENWLAAYRVGVLYEKLGDWDNAYHHYLKAYNIRNTRIEPLLRLAEHYWDKMPSVCYMYAQLSLSMPVPKDLLFVNPEDYDFYRYELVSRSAWYAGKMQEGSESTQRALAYKFMPHLASNLKIYVDELQKVPPVVLSGTEYRDVVATVE